MSEKVKEYEGGPGLYTEADFEAAKKKNYVNLIGMGVSVLLAVLFTVLNIIIGTIIAVIAFIVFAVLCCSQINKRKQMSLDDAITRTLGEHFEVQNANMVLKLSVDNFVADGREEIGDSELESEKFGEGIFSKKTRLVLPAVRVVAKYKDTQFYFDQYKIFEQVEKTHLTKQNEIQEKWYGPYNFIKVKTLKDFPGLVDIQSKLGGILGKFVGTNDIQVEDIEFNNTFDVTTNTELGAFRILTPQHIIKIKEFYESFKSKKVKKPDMHILFKEGYFYSRSVANSEIGVYHTAAKKVEKLDRYRKGLQPAIDYIKKYIDGLNLDTENYTTGD